MFEIFIKSKAKHDRIFNFEIFYSFFNLENKKRNHYACVVQNPLQVGSEIEPLELVGFWA